MIASGAIAWRVSTDVVTCRAAIAALVSLLATGCGSNGGATATTFTGARIRAAVPGRPARRPSRQAASSEFQYELPATVEGAPVQLHFRRLLATRRWQCSFHEHAAGEPDGFFCRREGASLDGRIADRGGYTLVVQVNGR